MGRKGPGREAGKRGYTWRLREEKGEGEEGPPSGELYK